LLRQAGIYASEVGQALGCEDAHHAGLAHAGEQRHDVATFASERGELVDDDEAGSGSLCGDAHQVEQEPGAKLRRQRRVGCGVEAEEHCSSGLNLVLESQSRPEILASDPFDDEAEPRPEPRDTFTLELAESVDLSAQSRSLR
jgi:hypothetical protein